MTKMPLIYAGVEAHDDYMSTYRMPQAASSGNRPWDRWLARVSAPFLDHQLATGYPEGASRVRAFRAQQISSRAGRRELAQCWQHVLDQARRPAEPRPARAPLCRDRVTAAEDDVRDMLAVLAGPLPISARGAAMASALLTDGTGPLYNRHCPRGLGAAVRDATSRMTVPFAGGVPGGPDREGAECYR